MKKRKTNTVLLVFALLTTVSMYSPGVHAIEPKRGGRLVIATQQDPITMLGAVSSHLHTHMISDTMFNGLVRQQWDSPEPLPDLAQRWQISEDGMTYTFYLVRNAAWHDGQPFTAADVKFTFEEVLTKHLPAGKILFGAIDRIKTPDSHTVVFELKYAYAPLMTWLMIKNFATIVPKHIYAGTDIVKNPHNFKPIGTGPFKFKEYVKGSHVRVVRNEKYFRKGQPYLDEIIIRIIPDWTSMLAAFETGEVDYLCWGIPRHSLPRLKKLPDVDVDLKVPTGNNALWTRFNLRHAALGNAKVRQAMAYATDKEEILKKVFHGGGRIAESFINPANPYSSWAYNPDIPIYEYNPKKANRMLDEAGFPRNSKGIRFAVRQYTSASDIEAGKTNEILREQWRRVGIDLKAIPLEGTAFPQLVYRNWDFDLAMGFWAFGPDPSLLGLHIHSRQIRKGLAPGNIMGYRNEKVDALLGKAAAATDVKKRAALYGEISKILAQDVPVLWFIFDKKPYAYRDRFVGLPTPAVGINGSYDEIWSKTGK